MTVSSMGELFLAIVNARGLKQNMKCLAMFHYFKQQHYVIICLQETHLIKQDIPIWKNQWGGKIIYVEGTAHSQGEMILISKNLNCEVNIIKQCSRLLVIHLKGEGIDVMIAKVYAPNLKAEKKIFFDLIFENLNDFKGSQVIIMGDFNIVINNDLDIVSGNPHCT